MANSEKQSERIVHALRSEAHEIFTLYESLDKYTKAAFLNKIAEGLGLPLKKAPEKSRKHSVSADVNETYSEPIIIKPVIDKSLALSMECPTKNSIKTRKVAFLVANGVKDESLNKMRNALVDSGATVKFISLKQGFIITELGHKQAVDGSFLTDASVMYDAIYIPDGERSIEALIFEPNSIHFVNEAYMQCKAIATEADGVVFLNETLVKEIEINNLDMEEAGVITNGNADKLISCIAKRFWKREELRKVPT